MSIRLKSTPRKPKRRTIAYRIQIYDGQTIQEVIDFLKVGPSQITFEIDRDYYSDNSSEDSVYAKFSRPQTDEEFEEDMAKYRERKRKYDSWYSENEKAIKQKIQLQKEKVIERRERVIRAERDRLTKELAKLEKRIN